MVQKLEVSPPKFSEASRNSHANQSIQVVTKSKRVVGSFSPARDSKKVLKIVSHKNWLAQDFKSKSRYVEKDFKLWSTTKKMFSIKGCVCYIFASLFCMSKRKHLQNKGKCFLFHFKSSCRSWDNQLLTF